MSSLRKMITTVALMAALPGALPQTLTAEMIMAMGNNSLFDRWRPYSHFSAPHGWMNDPCGPMYDPATKLYHMHYQYHPMHVNWGNISWGHATSPDLIYWTDVDHMPGDGLVGWQDTQANSLTTTNLTSDHHTPAMYNHIGIFSGTAQPISLSGEQDGTLLAFYTSVSSLPLQWNAPYPAGCESQSYSLSTDGGITWIDWPGNPVLPTPPWEPEVLTGWRDPFFLPIPQLDKMLGYKEPHHYLVFGSGIKGDNPGPRMPLYSTPTSNMTQWKFLGNLWEPAGNTSLGSLFETGSYGYNFEVANFYELDGHWFVGAGTQGGSVDFHQQGWVLWNEGTIAPRGDGSIAFTPRMGGVQDWGLLYAITTFQDTKNNRRIQYGWAWEDMNNFGIVQQGFQGAFSLPRKLYVKKTSGLAYTPDLDEVPGNSLWTSDINGLWTATTLGVRPARDVVAGLRKGSHYKKYNLGGLPFGNAKLTAPRTLATQMQHSYEIKATIVSTTGPVGFVVAASPDREEYTTIYYDPATSSVFCDRSHSSLITEFLNRTYVGYFQPYTIAGTVSPPVADYTESIVMDIFVDGSLVEIFINERFAMTSRIYPAREDSNGIGIFVEGGAVVEFGTVEIWDGLVNVWPNRPTNSSSLLVQDTPAEDGNGTWWQGN